MSSYSHKGSSAFEVELEEFFIASLTDSTDHNKFKKIKDFYQVEMKYISRKENKQTTLELVPCAESQLFTKFKFEEEIKHRKKYLENIKEHSLCLKEMPEHLKLEGNEMISEFKYVELEVKPHSNNTLTSSDFLIVSAAK